MFNLCTATLSSMMPLSFLEYGFKHPASWNISKPSILLQKCAMYCMGNALLMHVSAGILQFAETVEIFKEVQVGIAYGSTLVCLHRVSKLLWFEIAWNHRDSSVKILHFNGKQSDFIIKDWLPNVRESRKIENSGLDFVQLKYCMIWF